MTDSGTGLKTEIMTLNFGPQHPATHGTLRIVMELDGETVVKATPHIGFLHRGFEKLAEHHTYHQFIVHTDRLDYLGPLANNVGYVLAVEKLLGLEVTPRCRYMRVILSELARIADHLLWLGTAALDLGAFTALLYSFREREQLYDIFENVTGARLTTSFTRIGGMAADLPDGFGEQVAEFTRTFPDKIDEYERLLTRNKIWARRTRGVGVISAEEAISYGLSGPNLRACGVEHDLRRAQPYLGYEEFDFQVPVGGNGDAYDRYLCRIEEMRQSNEIVKQAMSRLPSGPVNVDLPRVVLPEKESVYNTMEGLIHHFKLIVDGVTPPAGEVYQAVEAPNGELGFFIVSAGEGKPYRMRIRSPSFCNYSAFPPMLEGAMLSDTVALLGSLNIIAGELDR
jgi:NADH-quinone oxidoreductase subunit D